MSSITMKRARGVTTALGLSLALFFCAAFSCSQGKQRTTSSQPTAVNETAHASSGAVDDLSGLPGTDWAVLPYKTMPDIFAFCPSGRWELQSSAAFGGRYQISGKRVVMKLDDGSTYADCTLAKRDGNEIYLSCGSDNLHLRYHGKNNCK